jgi:hypothetical protein
MPYISLDRRDPLDGPIEALQEELANLGRTPGDLNYVITRLIGNYFQSETCYSTIALICGVLDNVKAEFYRRVAGPYEDHAIHRSGDVEEFYNILRGTK